MNCWGRSESGVDDGGGVVGSSAVWRVYSGDILEHVSKFLLNVIRVGWRFENLSL